MQGSQRCFRERPTWQERIQRDHLALIIVQVTTVTIGQRLGANKPLTAQEEQQEYFPLGLLSPLNFVNLEKEFTLARFQQVVCIHRPRWHTGRLGKPPKVMIFSQA